MKRLLKDKRLLLSLLLVVWAAVLYNEFMGGETAAALEAIAPPGATPAVAAEVEARSSDTATPGASAAGNLAGPEEIKAQREATALPWHRNPFELAAATVPLQFDREFPQAAVPGVDAVPTRLCLTSILGKRAVINGNRFEVGDEIPNGGRLVRIDFCWVEIEKAGTVHRLHLLPRSRQSGKDAPGGPKEENDSSSQGNTASRE